MNSVARLVFTYYFGTPWLRWFSALGIVLIGYGALAMTLWPRLPYPEAVSMTGVGALFAGSSVMPLIFGSLVRSRQIHLLPQARLKLLASAFVTTLLVSLPLPLLSLLAVVSSMPERALNSSFYAGGTLLDFLQSIFLWQMLLVVFFSCTWLYVALWFATSSRVHGRPGTQPSCPWSRS